MPYLLLILMAVLMSIGQVLFKLGAVNGGANWQGFSALPVFIWSLASNIYVWLTLAVYAIAFALYFIILSKADLSFAFPFITAAVLIVVMLTSWLLFGESITLTKTIAAIFIVAGIVLLGWG